MIVPAGPVLVVAMLLTFASDRGHAQTSAQKKAALANPQSTFWQTKAPDTVIADIKTTKGTATLQLIRDWAPHGVDRFYNLSRAGYFDDSRFYRVLKGFIAQFGIAGNPTIASRWARQTIPADSAREKNVRGTIAFAQTKPADRTTNLFVNLDTNRVLDSLGFVPIGRVISGMEVLDSLSAKYGDVPSMPPPLGNPKRLYGESNAYLDKEFPGLDRLIRVVIRP